MLQQAVETEPVDYCGACKKAGAIHRCPLCRVVYYCDRACQVGAWRAHKRQCQPCAIVLAEHCVAVRSRTFYMKCKFVPNTHGLQILLLDPAGGLHTTASKYL